MPFQLWHELFQTIRRARSVLPGVWQSRLTYTSAELRKYANISVLPGVLQSRLTRHRGENFATN